MYRREIYLYIYLYMQPSFLYFNLSNFPVKVDTYKITLVGQTTHYETRPVPGPHVSDPTHTHSDLKIKLRQPSINPQLPAGSPISEMQFSPMPLYHDDT